MECKKNEIYTIEEVSKIMKWNPMTIRRKIKAGMIPARKFGWEWRILGDDILKLFKEKMD